MSIAEPPAPSAAPLQPLAERPEIRAIDARIRALADRLEVARQRRERAKHASAAPKPARSPLERAETLAAGGHIPGTEPGAEVAAADAEEKILRDGIAELQGQRDEIVSRLNYEASMSYQPQHVAALRRLDTAIGEASAAMSALYAIADELVRAGYMPSVSALPANVPRLVQQLGNPDDPRFHQAWTFRKWLRKTFPAGDR